MLMDRRMHARIEHNHALLVRLARTPGLEPGGASGILVTRERHHTMGRGVGGVATERVPSLLVSEPGWFCGVILSLIANVGSRGSSRSVFC